MKEYKYKINGNLYKVSVGEIEKNIAHVEVNGTVYNVEMEEAAPVKVSAPKPSSAPCTATGEPVISKPTSVSSGADAVKSPLPGVVNDILVNVGDTVNVGQTVLILEAEGHGKDIRSENSARIGLYASRKRIVQVLRCNVLY